ncbi:MAG: TIGR01777 family oxidoreductase [Acidimicrobiales bacterium]
MGAMRIAVTGSHGFIGSALVACLKQRGHSVTRIVRSAAAPGDIEWNPAAGTLDPEPLAGIEGAVNLAGAPIGDKRWTEDRKQEIRSSRVESTGLLAARLAELPAPPGVLVSGSAIGFYGNRGDTELDEGSPPGSDFLAEVCRQWEEATAPAESAGIRVVHVRTGIVLGAEGGMLKKLLPLFRLGLGGKLASGTSYQSWISLEDEVAAIVYALETASLTGATNLTAPGPVTNAELTETLGRVLHRPAMVPVPRFAMAAALGPEMADVMLLASQRVLPTKLLTEGFEFRYPDLEGALRAAATRG